MKNKTNKNKTNSIKWAVRLVFTASVIVVYYFIFSVMFDTPIEAELKNSTQVLQNHYKKLVLQYDSLRNVIANLAKRDTAIYQIIYEAKPFKEISQHSQHKFDLQLSLIDKTNKEMGEIFLTKLDKLEQHTHNQSTVVNSIVNYVITESDRINRIPGVQPIDNPELTLFATSFGRRINPFYKTMQDHTGIDYSIPEGTAIFATADGYISKILRSGSTNGLSITIDHQNGYKTVYAYLDNAQVSVGQKVNRGDIIAQSGNTGLSYAPHLHYEILKDGKYVDPLGYMFLELNRDNYFKIIAMAPHAMQAFD